MTQSYCPSCYRSMPPDETVCRSCYPDHVPRPSRTIAWLGVAGVPVLITGVLTFNMRLCLAGAIVSGAAVLLQVIVWYRRE